MEKDFVVYTNENGIQIEIKFSSGDLWLTTQQIGKLFDRDARTIRHHITNIYTSNKLKEEDVCKKFRKVYKTEKKHFCKDVRHYNTDMVSEIDNHISVSISHFKKWFIVLLKAVIKNGEVPKHYCKTNFNVELFKDFSMKVRDIREAENSKFKQLIHIFSTSTDYNPSSDTSRLFFRKIQNIFHFAVTGKTANEIVIERIDYNKRNLGMISFGKNYKLEKKDLKVAKNYMTSEELEFISLLCEQFVGAARIKSFLGREMSMKCWLLDLEGFISYSGLKVLDNDGLSKEKRDVIVNSELDKYKERFLQGV